MIESTYIVIGAGPAGLQLGQALKAAGRDHLILEAGDVPGAFFEQFPRHRKLISINKRHTGYDDPEINLRWDWHSLLSPDDDLRFTRYSKAYFPHADVMVRYCRDYAERFDLDVRYGTRVVRITRLGHDGRFHLDDAQGNEYVCDRLIVATGVSKPYIPPIEGIELAEQYVDVSVDADEFIGQRVLIIGKGNSAFETADHLVPTASVIHLASPNPIKMAWQTHFVGHVRAVNNNLLDTYQLKLQNAVLNATIDGIRKVGDTFAVTFDYTLADGEREVLEYDRIICCTGFRFDTDIFADDCTPAMAIDDRFPDQDPFWQSTNVPDLYFAGTITQMRDYKRSTSGFIHGFRYNVRSLFRALETRYHGVDWPRTTFETTPEVVTGALIRRINQTSALWQQFGFLADLMLVDDRTGIASYLEEVPVDAVFTGSFGALQHAYLITLEYGPHTTHDPFGAPRIERHDVARSAQSQFLHPIVRCIRDGEVVETHHVIEDLASEWKEPEHVDPLRAFFAAQFGGPTPVRA